MTTRYVNTASTAGGDGTTNATTGANRAYASLSEWEAAEQASLTEDHEVLCCGATDDGQCTIDGWTPNSFRIIVSGNTGDSAGAHAGVYDAAKYLATSNSSTLATLNVVEDNVTVRRIQLLSSHADGMAVGRAGPVGLAFIGDRLVLKGPGTTSSSLGAALADLNNTNVKIKNSIAYDWVVGIYVRQESAGAGDSYIVNCTAHSCSQGIRGQDNTSAAAYIQAINNLAFGNTTDWVDTNSGFDQTNSVNNAFGNSGTACPGSSDIDLSTYANADIFVDAANDDFHLNSSGSAYSLLDNNGVGPSSNSEVTSEDIEGDTRSGTTTSVGADVVASSGISGSGATTNAGDTGSASATVTSAATAATVNAGDTSAAAAAVSSLASAAVTNAADTPAGQAVLSAIASAATTNAGDTANGSASVVADISAAGATTNAGDSAAASAVVAAIASAATTNAGDLGSGTGLIGVVGRLLAALASRAALAGAVAADAALTATPGVVKSLQGRVKTT